MTLLVILELHVHVLRLLHDNLLLVDRVLLEGAYTVLEHRFRAYACIVGGAIDHRFHLVESLTRSIPLRFAIEWRHRFFIGVALEVGDVQPICIW